MEWTCPRCGKTGIIGSRCPTCSTPIPPNVNSSSTVTSISTSTPDPTPTPGPTPIPGPTPTSSSGNIQTSQARFIEHKNFDGSKTIIDNLNNYTIEYTESTGYTAYDENGDCVYKIDNDGTAFINIKYYNGDKGFLINGDPLTIEDISKNMCIKSNNGIYDFYLSNGYVEKINYFNQDGILKQSNHYELNGDYQIEYYNDDGNSKIDYYEKNGNIYKTVDKSIDGNDEKIVLWGTIENKNVKVILYSDGTCAFKSDKPTYLDGTYSYDSSGNIICITDEGDSYYYDSYGNATKRVNKDGSVYIYNIDKDSQIVTKNGHTSYSKINHIEYDEDAYTTILNGLNSVDGSTISNACSDIESAVNSFPDSYSCNIGEVGSGIADNISLISSLSEMVNYSLLAYQTCDEELRRGLYSLIDSLFGDSDKEIANRFKDAIKNTIEDRNNDGILEYKEDTNFRYLSQNAIVTSTYVDENGNIWYINKNNIVVGIKGENISLDYGEERFDLTYDENGIITLKDSKGKPLNIFGDYNLNSGQFGGDQGGLKDSYNNQYVNDVLSKYFPDSSLEEQVALLDKAVNTGCGHVAVTNLIFKSYEGNEQEFYDTFGFPMYEVKCNKDSSTGDISFSVDFNYEPVIMDLYSEVNSESGNLDIKSTITTAGGVTPQTVEKLLSNAEKKYNVDFSNIPSENKFYLDYGYSLYESDGTLICMGSSAIHHAMIGVGQNEYGQQLVSNGGELCIYEPSENCITGSFNH